MVSVEDFERRQASGGLVQWHERYGNLYGVDRLALNTLWATGAVPVIHVGRRVNLAALRSDVQALSVLLWSSCEEARRRLDKRGDPCIPARLRAWNEELADLRDAPRDAYDLVLRTDDAAPDQVAGAIIAAFQATPADLADVAPSLQALVATEAPCT